ncbi:MAG: PilW family protein, partial [Candidatus Tectomicrobia bacterium]
MTVANVLNRRTPPPSPGFSLVELMVAMLIGLILTAGVILVFAGNRHSYNVNNSFAKVQESGRYALEALLRDVRLAGYWGGYEDLATNIEDTVDPASAGCNSGAWARMAEQRIYGLDDTNNDGTATGDYTNADCIPAYLRGDVLAVRHAVPFTSAPAALAANRNYIITDIDKASIFTTTVAPHVAPPGFLQPASIHELVAHAYYVAIGNGTCNIGLNPSAGQALPSLYRVTVTGPGVSAQQEIITGVQDFQVQYGLDVNGDSSIDGYVDGDTVGADWADVIAVRLWLLLRSPCSEPD